MKGRENGGTGLGSCCYFGEKGEDEEGGIGRGFLLDEICLRKRKPRGIFNIRFS